MPWQPTTRWEDISATLDTPLSDETIRLLNERNQSLERYLSTSTHQVCTFDDTFTDYEHDSGRILVGEIIMPRSSSGWVTATLSGKVALASGAYSGRPRVFLTLRDTSATSVGSQVVSYALGTVSSTSGEIALETASTSSRFRPSGVATPGAKIGMYVEIWAGNTTSTFQITGTAELFPSNNNPEP